MNTKTAWLGILIASFTVSTANAADAKTANWATKMQSLNRTLSEVIEDAIAMPGPKDPKYKRLEKNVDQLSKLAHQIRMPEGKPDSDPTLTLVAGMMADQVKQAQVSLKRGARDYARGVLLTIPGYCIACHTRGAGATAPPASLLKLQTPKGLTAMDAGRFQAATWQYDAAIESFQKGMKEESPTLRPIEWQRSLRTAVAIAVRSKNDPALALSILEQAKAAPQLPVFLKNYVDSWAGAVNAWKSETGRKLTNEEGLYAEAVRLSGLAMTAQKYPVDRSGEVQWLRATRVLHDLLAQYPNGDRAQEALWLLGNSYDALRDLELWTMHDLYYEGCIRKDPSKPAAKRCYSRLEESLIAGFSGSGGTHLPTEIRLKLEELDALIKNPKKVVQ